MRISYLAQLYRDRDSEQGSRQYTHHTNSKTKTSNRQKELGTCASGSDTVNQKAIFCCCLLRGSGPRDLFMCKGSACVTCTHMVFLITQRPCGVCHRVSLKLLFRARYCCFAFVCALDFFLGRRNELRYILSSN